MEKNTNGNKIKDNPFEPLSEKSEKLVLSKQNDPINGNETTDSPVTSYLRFNVNERPPILLNLFLAIQNIVTSIGSTLVICLTIAEVICADINDPIRAKIFCTALFLNGLSTAIQSAFGIRLPVFQGTSAAFIGPLLSMKTANTWQCTDDIESSTDTFNTTSFRNVSKELQQELVYYRLTELQGSLMLAGLITEVFLGATGCLGLVTKFVGPITVSVTITSLGLGMYPIPLRYVASHIPVAFGGVLLVIIFIFFLDKIHIGIPQTTCCRKRDSPALSQPKRHTRISIFRTFPIILTLVITWSVCAILTVTGVLPKDPKDPAYGARTDNRGDVISMSPWIFFPYPGQFGPIRFNTAIFIGFICAYLVGCVESIGDYMTISRITGTYPPPQHAFNRGILVEGLMGVLAGALGAGYATTSYSENIAIIKITEVASRSVLILAGCLCMVFAIIGKFGAFMTSVPHPVVGAIAFVQFGLLVSIGISSLKHVSLTSTRNLTIIGVSIYVGLVSSEWLKLNRHAINSGSPTGDQIIKLILGTPMFLAAITSFVLDNIAKGTNEERGMGEMTTDDDIDMDQSQINRSVYDLPGIARLQQKMACFGKIPFIQPYRKMAI